MQRYTVYLYLETAFLGGTSNHHQERIQLHLVFVTLLLSAAIVEKLELV